LGIWLALTALRDRGKPDSNESANKLAVDAGMS